MATVDDAGFSRLVEDIADDCFTVALERIREEQQQSQEEGYNLWSKYEFQMAVEDAAGDLLYERYVEAIDRTIKQKLSALAYP